MGRIPNIREAMRQKDILSDRKAARKRLGGGLIGHALAKLVSGSGIYRNKNFDRAVQAIANRKSNRTFQSVLATISKRVGQKRDRRGRFA